MAAVWTWIKDNPAIVFALTYALLNFMNALLPYPKAQGMLRMLHDFVDTISALVRHDSPGTVKVPLAQRSAPPDGSSARGSISRLKIAFLIPIALFAAFQTSCATVKKLGGEVIDCAKEQMLPAFSPLVDLLLGVLAGGSPDWGKLLAAEQLYGEAAVVCAVQHILADAKYAMTHGKAFDLNVVSNATSYLKAKGVL